MKLSSPGKQFISGRIRVGKNPGSSRKVRRQLKRSVLTGYIVEKTRIFKKHSTHRMKTLEFTTKKNVTISFVNWRFKKK